MVVTPDSRIILLKSPLKLDHSNQITFASVESQFTYFYGLTKLEHGSFSYIRKEGVVRIPTHIAENDGLPTYEDLLEYNYCMYQNTHYDMKWFYAYITDVSYANDGMATITLETDVFQTWQFDLVYKNSFVEREHVSDDTIGLHTVPENVECGEYVISDTGNIGSSYLSYTHMRVCIGTAWIPDNTPTMWASNRLIGNVYSGTYYFVLKTTTDASKFIQGYADLGHAQDIQCLFMIPDKLANITNSTTWQTGGLGNQNDIYFITLHGSTGAINIDTAITISMQTTLNGYTPKNKKLLCYPYNCLTITNNAGTMCEYRYEDFISNSPAFSLVGLQAPSCPMMLFPTSYKKNSTSASGYAWGLPLAKIPQGSWNADMYTNWMTQNGVNIMGMRIDAATSHAIMGSLQAMTGAATLSADGISGGLGSMFGAITEQYRASMIPNQIGGQTTVGDITFAYDKLMPTYYKMTIRSEYAQIIDNFFSMYGYKVNLLKTPNIHKRTYWDYIKTIDVNLEGNIPEKDLDEIRRMFNAGCTFWHDTSKFLDYSQTNSILS